ncbi:MAG: hypothetical protein E5W30_03985 [Mesorhizobium sp.]|nr:MAG: hypothetical protein E5W30_03985 [Mesorhizobium sp.]
MPRPLDGFVEYTEPVSPICLLHLEHNGSRRRSSRNRVSRRFAALNGTAVVISILMCAIAASKSSMKQATALAALPRSP